MALFGTKKEDMPPAPPPAINRGGPSFEPRASGAPGPVRVGIDHAINLMRSLPTAQDIDLVVTVLKTTLESLNIRIADIVNDASQRQHDIENRVVALKAEIQKLEGEVEARLGEIRRLEAAHEETTRVKEYLQKGGKPESGTSTPSGPGQAP
jgi:hypothetical protein